MNNISRTLIVVGLGLVVVGIAWPVISRLGLGRLPGDIAIERENFRFYFPLTTLLLVNVVLWVLMRLFGSR